MASRRVLPLYQIPQREPNIHRTMDNLSILYLDAGIVTPVVIPKIRNPAAEPFGYLLKQGGDEVGNR